MASSETILIIEDEADLAETIQSELEAEGFRVLCASCGRTGLESAVKLLPSLIILDRTLPGMSGIDVCRVLRERPTTKQTPIIFLTAKSEKGDIILGLGTGGDDYITKPFDMGELIARVKGVLRRSSPSLKETHPGGTRLTFGPLQLDSARFEAFLGKSAVALTQAEFRILWTLMERPGQVFSRNQLLDKFDSRDSAVDRTIDVHIASIRKKLGEKGELVMTIRGMGYKLRES